jgi:hypothetical protein
MALRRQKSRRERITGIAADYLKLKAAGKAAKGAGKGAKKTAKGTAVAIRKSSKVKRAGALAAGAGVLAVVAAKLIHGRGEGEPAAA